MGAQAIYLDMPYAVDEPHLAAPEVGIDRVSRRGRNRSYVMDVTLLDTPDHRLIRAGIFLAHRVSDGLGEWYLDAPGWRPYLPAERSEPMDAFGDLPEEFAKWVRPFRRRSALGAVAALTIDRVEYVVHGHHADGRVIELATIRDDKLTVRRGGITTTRAREVTLKPKSAIKSAQLQHLMTRLAQAGGTQVTAFPPLTRRLGAPATGLTDFPEPRPLVPGIALDSFVASVFAHRLQAIVHADLAARRDGTGWAQVAREVSALRADLRGLSSVLEPESREKLETDVAAMSALVGDTPADAGLPERYFEVLDELVLAARAPRVGDLGPKSASSVLRQRAEAALVIVTDRCDSLLLGSPVERWRAALAAVTQLRHVTAVASVVMPKPAKKLRRLLQELSELLEPCVGVPEAPPEEQLRAMSALEAFEAGREYELAVSAGTAAQIDFIDAWPAVHQQLGKVKVHP